jgi:hypothetical protein
VTVTKLLALVALGLGLLRASTGEPDVLAVAVIVLSVAVATRP